MVKIAPRMQYPSIAYPRAAKNQLDTGYWHLFVWLRAGKWYWLDLDNDDGSPYRIEDMAELASKILPSKTAPGDDGKLWTAGGVLVVSTRSQGRQLASHLRRNNQRGLARLIEVSLSTRSSSRVVILSEALGRKIGGDNLSSAMSKEWSISLGLGPDLSQSVIRRMMLACYRHGLDLDDEQLSPHLQIHAPAVVAPMVITESSNAMFARLSGSGMESTRFTSAVAISDAWEYVEIVDPNLRELSYMDGQVFTITTDKRGTTVISTNFRVREGKRICVAPTTTCDPMIGDHAIVLGVSADIHGTFTIELSKPLGTIGKPVDVTIEPFLPTFRGRPGDRWIGRSGQAPPKVSRRLPNALAKLV